MPCWYLKAWWLQLITVKCRLRVNTLQTLTDTHHIVNREVDTEQCWHIRSYISLCNVLSIIYRHLWFRAGFTFDPGTPWHKRCECFSSETWSVCSWKIRIMLIGYKKGTKRQLAVATLFMIKVISRFLGLLENRLSEFNEISPIVFVVAYLV